MPKDSDEKEENKSVGYWRRNSLMALRENREFERDAVNPDHLAAIQADNAEIAQFEAQEAAVKTRHASIITKRREREQGNDKSR